MLPHGKCPLSLFLHASAHPFNPYLITEEDAKLIESIDGLLFQGLNAKDAFHVKQDLDMKLSDKECLKPTRSSISKHIGKNKASDVQKIKIHFVDLNEPGRSSCMSTDECGAYVY